MSTSGSFSEFNSLLDKATNPMQLQPDSESVKKICHAIDKGVVECSYAVQALYGKMIEDNPHTVLFAIKVLERIFFECGNLVYSVVCTQDSMRFLKDIVETTQHQLIRDKILELLESWANTFKHFTQYSAPEKLLKSLQADGYVFPGFEKNSVCEPKRQQKNINVAANLFRPKIESVKSVKELSNITDSNNKDSGIDSDTDMKNRESYFMQSLKEIQEKKKRDFKQHQKSLGLPTSSDEEDNAVASKEQDSQISHEENFNFPTSPRLHPELRNIKQSRWAVEKELQEYRNSKQEEFKQKTSNGYINDGFHETLQLSDPGQPCSTCEKYKKKCNHEQVFERSVPRLHPDLRKIKESREMIKNSFEEVKKQKRQAFYGTTSGDWVDNSDYKSYTNKSSYESENEQLQKALELSRTDTNSLNLRKPRTRLGEVEEQKALEEALRLSLLQTGPNHSSEDDELQRAIDISVAEVEDENFSAFPKLDNNDEDNVLLSYITELSLDDSYETEHKLAELYADYDVIEPCVICRTETKFLKSFKPCNHKCICDTCSKKYTSQLCPICRAYYTSINF